MKEILIPVFLLLIPVSTTFCQNGFSKKRMIKMYSKFINKPIPDMVTNVASMLNSDEKVEEVTKTVIIATPNIPQNFSKIVQDANQEWQLSGELNLGVSYGIVIGEISYKKLKNVSGSDLLKMTPLSNGKVHPHFGIGIHFSGGTTQDFQSGGLTENLNIGASIIILNFVNFFAGYDLLNKTSVIGLGARVDFVQYGGFGTSILNKEAAFN